MSTPDNRPKFPRAIAAEVLEELLRAFEPVPRMIYEEGKKPRHTPWALADRFCAVGGFRRRKAEMKDLEILYIPRIVQETDPGDMFGATRAVNVSERAIDELLVNGTLEKRPSVAGVTSWGSNIKLARHVATGLPVDLLAATPENWFNRLVVTTGPRELNILIADRAHERGFDWKVAEADFVPRGAEWEGCSKRVAMKTEREVFSFVDLEIVAPELRTGKKPQKL